MPAGLRVTFGGKTYEVQSVEEAQAKWVEFRDRSGAGVSEIGNGIRVTDGAGRFVARISYNGRAWSTEDDGRGGAEKPLRAAPDEQQPETREQAIRRTWASAPRPVNQWTPMTVSVGEGDARRSNDMLVIQRKARGDGQADSVLTMRVLRMGRLLASDPPEPLMFTFKLTGENKVEQVGRARVPTAEDIAQWEGAGFTVPGKKAEAPKPAKPAEESKPVEAPAADRDAQDRQGLREEDRRARTLASAAEELTSQIQGDIAENDFAADEVMPGLRLFAEQSKVPADELRQEVLTRIRKSGMKRGDIKRVEKALDPTKEAAPKPSPAPAVERVSTPPAPAPAPEPAPTNPPAPAAQTRPERLIELRKRQSVLKQLLECLG